MSETLLTRCWSLVSIELFLASVTGHEKATRIVEYMRRRPKKGMELLGALLCKLFALTPLASNDVSRLVS